MSDNESVALNVAPAAALASRTDEGVGVGVVPGAAVVLTLSATESAPSPPTDSGDGVRKGEAPDDSRHSTGKGSDDRTKHDANMETSGSTVTDALTYAAFFYIGFTVLASYNTIIATFPFIKDTYNEEWESIINWLTSTPNVVLTPFVGLLGRHFSYSWRLAGLFMVQFVCAVWMMFTPEIMYDGTRRIGGRMVASVGPYVTAVIITSAALAIIQGSAYSLGGKCGGGSYIQAVSTGTASSGFLLPLWFYFAAEIFDYKKSSGKRLGYNVAIWGTTAVVLIFSVFVFFWLKRRFNLQAPRKDDSPVASVNLDSGFKPYLNILKVNWFYASVCFGNMFSNFSVFPNIMFEIESDHFEFGQVCLWVFGACDLISRLTKDFLRPACLEWIFSKERVHFALLARFIVIYPSVYTVFLAQRGYAGSFSGKGIGLEILLLFVYMFCAFTSGYTLNCVLALGSDQEIARKALTLSSPSGDGVKGTSATAEEDKHVDNEKKETGDERGSSDETLAQSSDGFSDQTEDGNAGHERGGDEGLNERIASYQEKAGLVMTYALVTGIFFGNLLSFFVVFSTEQKGKSA